MKTKKYKVFISVTVLSVVHFLLNIGKYKGLSTHPYGGFIYLFFYFIIFYIFCNNYSSFYMIWYYCLFILFHFYWRDFIWSKVLSIILLVLSRLLFVITLYFFCWIFIDNHLQIFLKQQMCWNYFILKIYFLINWQLGKFTVIFTKSKQNRFF